MVVIAVVGGTGSVGKTIVEAFVEDKTYDVIVLARKVPEGENKAPVFAVDYNNVEQLTKTLEENNVHTIISTISMGDETAATSELNLVQAAAKAKTTKRFVASNWGNAAPDDESIRIPHNFFRLQVLDALRKTDLEWTQVYNGIFLDYYGMPHVQSYLTPIAIFVDIANQTAGVPGSGDEEVSFAYTKDVAKFVVAAQGLPKWDEALYCYSENSTVGEVVRIAEEVTGSKFTVTYDSVEKLRNDEMTELPAHKAVYPFFPKQFVVALFSRFGIWAAKGLMYVPKEGSLNEKFPEIKTSSVRDVVGAWKGK